MATGRFRRRRRPRSGAASPRGARWWLKLLLLAGAGLILLAVLAVAGFTWWAFRVSAHGNPWSRMSEEQLIAAAKADPSQSGPHEGLGHYYAMQEMSARDESARVALARKSLNEYEIAYTLAAGDSRDLLLKDLGWFAYRSGDFPAAAKRARAMLAVGTQDWNTGNQIHHGHALLGLVALKRDDVATAEAELLLSGGTTGSPQLNSFGPNMTLANELLRRGRREVVLKYFDLCGRFWSVDFGKLRKWRAAVERGEPPAFGANLVY